MLGSLSARQREDCVKLLHDTLRSGEVTLSSLEKDIQTKLLGTPLEQLLKQIQISVSPAPPFVSATFARK